MSGTKIDITSIPFSRYGAYVAVTREHGKNGESAAKELIIHSSRRRFEEGPVFSLCFKKDNTEVLEFCCDAVPEFITVKSGHEYARLYIRDDDTLVIDSYGLDIHLKLLCKGHGTEIDDRTYRILTCRISLFATISVPCGKAVLEGPYQKCESGEYRNHRSDMEIKCENGRILMAVAIKSIEPKAITLPICPENEISMVRAEWEGFLEQMPKTESANEMTKEFINATWYTLWSSFVRADRCYQNDTMMMSKKFMSSVWSWDHCFNALAMSNLVDQKLAKQQALNQFAAPFALQSENGALPDSWNPDREALWAVTKPPVHGWCFDKLMDKFEFDNEELKTVYTWLEKWTNWWMNFNDTDRDGIPDYPRGEDSGWDNSTVFDIGFFVESPDLPAFLILQMRTLARISAALGREETQKYWMKESEDLMNRLLEHSWNGICFLAKKSGSHEYDETPTSLLSLIPLVLGDLLPEDIYSKLVENLECNFLTENGLATEMPTSEQYNPDGYWRGPIWAPSTYLIVDGLRKSGYDKLAGTIAERYYTMSCNKAKGNYENFDAITGAGLRAPGYTWSASVCLMLYWEFN